MKDYFIHVIYNYEGKVVWAGLYEHAEKGTRRILGYKRTIAETLELLLQQP